MHAFASLRARPVTGGEELIRQADVKLFEAKKRGKNRVASFSRTAQS